MEVVFKDKAKPYTYIFIFFNINMYLKTSKKNRTKFYQ